MTPGSLFSLAAGLAMVLGLMALVVRVAKKLRPDLVGKQNGPGLEILSRQPLSPRQGVAVARFERRLLLLSYGEGGVRLLQDVSEDEIEERAAPADGPETAFGTSFPKTWSRVRRAAGLGTGALLVALLLGGPSALGAQSASNGGAASSGAAQALPGTPTAGSLPDTAANGIVSDGALWDLARRLPSMDLQVGEEEGISVSGPVGTVLFIGFLTLLPTVLLMMTGFTRILVVLHLLKQAMGTQTAPPSHLLAAMALLLTAFVMAPTLREVNQAALVPWMDGEMDEVQMLQTASGSFRRFMLHSTGEEDLRTFMEMHGGPAPETVDDIPMVVVTSAFVTSELRHAFQIGFALFLPFVVIDIVVASVLMSMGMFMLPPVMVSLPFKLLLFVLVDGWSLVVGGLVQSFA